MIVGTAGHVDHGKTALVGALTGADTDRLAEEKRRGISIELGYARLDLGEGRWAGVVDVPGHERLVRTMVAGATGIDLFLLCVAADDGVMPQTREHVAVLRGLGVRAGVVAVTKADLADPGRAAGETRELLGDPAVEVVVASGTTGAGVGPLRAALARAAGAVTPAADAAGAPVLHVDRVFTVRGAGTVVTGTLWRGTLATGDTLVLQPSGRRVRVRGLQVHDAPVDRARAGQRVAVNLRDAATGEVARGDVLTAGQLVATHILDVRLDERVETGTRVQVHHGTRETAARVTWLGGGFHQLRCERPLVAERGDRLVVRSIAPPDTLGGGVVLDPAARRHGPGNDLLAALAAIERGEEPTAEAAADHALDVARAARARPPAPLSDRARELEAVLAARGAEGLPAAGLDAGALAQLRDRQRVVRVGRDGVLHADALDELADLVGGIVEQEGSITVARLRDELGTGRGRAQALLEALDAARVTRRDGDVRVLRRRGA